MLKKIWEFISGNAYSFMLLGMIVGVSGVLLLMRFDKTGGPKSAALILGIIGITIYILGRISLAFSNKRTKKLRDREE